MAQRGRGRGCRGGRGRGNDVCSGDEAELISLLGGNDANHTKNQNLRDDMKHLGRQIATLTEVRGHAAIAASCRWQCYFQRYWISFWDFFWNFSMGQIACGVNFPC